MHPKPVKQGVELCITVLLMNRLNQDNIYIYSPTSYMLEPVLMLDIVQESME